MGKFEYTLPKLTEVYNCEGRCLGDSWIDLSKLSTASKVAIIHIMDMDEYIKNIEANNKTITQKQKNCDHRWINNSFDQFGFLIDMVCDECLLKKDA